MKMNDGMKLLKLIRELAETQALLRETSIQLVEAKQDRELLAQVLCREEAFLDWLIDQDVSSAHMYVVTRKGQGISVPFSQRKRAEVEGKSDLELALAYCEARPNAG